MGLRAACKGSRGGPTPAGQGSQRGSTQASRRRGCHADSTGIKKRSRGQRSGFLASRLCRSCSFPITHLLCTCFCPRTRHLLSTRHPRPTFRLPPSAPLVLLPPGPRSAHCGQHMPPYAGGSSGLDPSNETQSPRGQTLLHYTICPCWAQCFPTTGLLRLTSHVVLT